MKDVRIFDFAKHIWTDGPPMNHGRSQHASICSGDSIYVFGGFMNSGSIEKLTIGQRQAWALIILPSQLTSRTNPMVCAHDRKTIIVYGGSRGQRGLSDGYALDTEKKSVTAVKIDKAVLSGNCHS